MNAKFVNHPEARTSVSRSSASTFLAAGLAGSLLMAPTPAGSQSFPGQLAVANVPRTQTTPINHVTVGGLNFEVERLTVPLATLDAQTEQYRVTTVGLTGYGVRVDVLGSFRAVFDRSAGPNSGVFGLQFEICIRQNLSVPGCGVNIFSHASPPFENAVRSATGQTMNQVKIVVERGVTTDTNSPFIAAFEIALDASGTPIRVTTPEGVTGYPSFGWVYFTGSSQASVGRNNFLLVEPTQ